MDLRQRRTFLIAEIQKLFEHNSDGSPNYEATEWSDEKDAAYKLRMNELKHVNARLDLHDYGCAGQPQVASAAPLNPVQGESIMRGERATAVKAAFQPIAEQIVAAGRGESMAAQTAATGKGLEVVPVMVDQRIEVALSADAPMPAVATMTTRDSGRTVNIPVLDASGIRAASVAEATAVVKATDLSFGAVASRPDLFATKYHEVSKTLDQDAAVDLVAELAAIHTSATMRGVSDAMTTGVGGTNVDGVMEDSKVTAVTNAASETALTHAEIVALIGALPERARRRSVLQFNQSTETALAQILYGADKVPIISRDPNGGITGTGGGVFHALGLGPVPYLLNPALENMAKGKTPILYGDMSRYRAFTAPNLNGHAGVEIVILRDSAFELKNTYAIFARWRVAGKYVSAADGHDARKLPMKA